MSDDKRKNARTQGRFSNEKEGRSHRKDKAKSAKENVQNETSSDKDATKSKQSLASCAVEGFNPVYQADAKLSLKELETPKKPIELRSAGAHQLSSTDNGISRVIYEPNFISEEEADELMTILYDSTNWHDKNIIIHGQEVPQPRLVAWYGPFSYSYSGSVLDPAEMPHSVFTIKERVEDNLKKHNLDVVLNSVLLNLYRNEKDSVSWHSDDELSMGISPTIASLSLGEIRKFEMRPKPHTLEQDLKVEDTIQFINMKPGSLIIMDGCMQEDWKHRVPKEYHDKSPRINLTFRTVFAIDKTSSKVPIHVPSAFQKQISPPTSESKLIVDSTDTTTWPDINDHGASGGKVSTDKHICDSTANPLDDSSSGISMSASENSAISPVPFDAIQNGSSYCALSGTNAHPDVLEGCVNDKFPHESNPESVPSSHVPHIKKSFKLNANAPDFIPKSAKIPPQPQYAYEDVDLVDLANMYKKTKISLENTDRFQSALFQRVNQGFESSFFSLRDTYELEVLQKISDGTQTAANQAVILARICSIIYNANKRQCDDNYSPGRSYAGRGGRLKDYGINPRQRNNYGGTYKRH